MNGVPRLKQWLQNDTDVYFLLTAPQERKIPRHCPRSVSPASAGWETDLPEMPWDLAAQQEEDASQLSLF